MATIEQRLQTAIRDQQAGRLSQAEAVYRSILQEQPHHPDVLHLLGLTMHQAGRNAEAIDLLSQALAIHPNYPVCHSNLAAVYLAAGRLAEAAAQAREAIRLKPDVVDAHQNLGHAMLRQGKLDEAAAAFREAIRLDPANIDALCNLGDVYQRLRKSMEAVAILTEAVRLFPAHAPARNSLAEALSAAGAPAEAAGHLKEALRLRPNYHEAWHNLGTALEAMRQDDAAIRCFREALRLNPDFTPARTYLAHALEGQGKSEEAVAELEETLRRDPNDAFAFSILGRFVSRGQYRFREEQVRHIEQLTQRPEQHPVDAFRLHQALASHHDREGAIDAAFHHCRRSKEQRGEWDRQRSVAFDPARHRQLIDRTIAVCTPAWFEQVRSFGSESELPIFIVGMMRSGTTLAEQILASHPTVHGSGELRAMYDLAATLPRRLGTDDSYPECLARLDATAARDMAQEYLQTLRVLGGPAQRVVDKMPFNFLRLGIIAALFPRARIIHCVRDPADTCLSCYFQYFSPSYPFTYDLRHLGQYYREYERLMEHWKQVLPVPMFELQYEELIQDAEGTTRRLVAFCGLEWDERCLRFHETQRVVRTASALQVRQGMYRSSVGRWKRYQAHLQPLLEVLGRRIAAESGEGCDATTRNEPR
jgi:tetratricopeptide (TPR) repeat protein